MAAAQAYLEKKEITKRTITLEKFLERYSNREDPFKYEWRKGTIEKKQRSMNRDQFYIYQNLLNTFIRTQAFAQKGMLMCEVDMYLPTYDRTRRADIAYLTSTQMAQSRDNKPSICPFVIEVISKNDQINEVSAKIIEYFENGIELVWVISPKVKKVEVYTSVKDVTICFGKDICSAFPVLPDFNISVNALFS